MIKRFIDEPHEHAAIVLFLIALGLELFAEFEDWATVGILFLGVVTLLGAERYRGLGIGPLSGGKKDERS